MSAMNRLNRQVAVTSDHPAGARVGSLLLAASCLCCVAQAQSGGSVTGQAGGLRAGAAASNITPPLGVSICGYFNDRRAEHVHDELQARCLVLDDGRRRLAIVICDSCMIPRAVTDAARQRIERDTGIPAGHVLVAATHTHSAPTCAGVFQSEPDADYQAFLIRRISDGVRRAANQLAPARLGWGSGRVPDQVFNRRWRMKPGSIPPNPFGGTNDLVRMNPPVGSPDLIEPAGPTDPELCVVSVQTSSGRPLAVLANYSLHYVGTSRGNDISADYFGAFCRRLAQLLDSGDDDPPFVAMLSNGTSGDVNNINFRQPAPARQPYEQIRLVADAVAAEAARVCRAIEHRDVARLGAEQTELRLGVRRPGTAEIERASAILARAAGRSLTGLEEVFARETMLLRDYPAEVDLIVQVLRIGDVGIVAIPCEVFAETGLELKARSPFRPTFTISLANGYNGYLPTPSQHALGGYETWRARSSYLEVGAAPKIVVAALELLPRLR